MSVTAARRLVEQRPEHRVISLYLDLDPEHFATAPARATQIRSLIDEARRSVEGDGTLGHDELVSLREDVERLERYLLSREPPFQGSRALAVFCSVHDDLFEVVPLHHPVPGQVVVDRSPYVEPLIAGAGGREWCVALVSRAESRIFTGSPDAPRQRGRIADDVHGQHDQGGWSQARYERSVEQDADNHLRGVADELRRLWQRLRFDVLALGGPHEVVTRFASLLPQELSSRRVPEEVDIDVATASDDAVRDAIAGVVERVERDRERAALDALAEGLGANRRATGGLEDTLDALNERRVGVLLLEQGAAEAPGGRCPSCGLLIAQADGECPADGTRLEPVAPLRAAMIEAALTQDAEVIRVQRFPDLGPHRGVAALARF